MTGYTFCGKRCETQRSMTLLALQFNMCPRQRKACLGMIESGRQPGVGSVAGCAARAKLTLVSIIRFMTGVTISGKCCEAWGGMALCAGQVAGGLMRFHDRKREFLRPPGALPEEEFLSLCNRCLKCQEVCPWKAITPVRLTESVIRVGTPRLRWDCPRCMRCIRACPTGALGWGRW